MSRETLSRSDAGEHRLARRRRSLPVRGNRPVRADRTDAGREPGAERSYKGHVTPPYEVEFTDGPFEVRLYRPFTVAETLQEGARRPSLSRGFRALAGYIFGGNAGERKIAMAAPVEQEPGSLRGWRVRFMMPPGETPETLPPPRDEAVAFRFTAEERLAVVRFSGFATARRLAREELRLRTWAKRRRLPLALTARHLYYDDPMTLPWRRRTEVAVAVK